MEGSRLVERKKIINKESNLFQFETRGRTGEVDVPAYFTGRIRSTQTGKAS